MEPHEANEHVLRRSAFGGILYAVFFSIKAVAVMQVGIGVKIHLYAPIAPTDKHFSTAARFHLALSLAACFGLIHFMKPLHKGFKRYYSPSAMKEVPERVLVQLASIGTLGVLVALAAAPLLPYQMMALAALCSVVQVCLAWVSHQLDLKMSASGESGKYASSHHPARHGHGHAHVARLKDKYRTLRSGCTASATASIPSTGGPTEQQQQQQRISWKRTAKELLRDADAGAFGVELIHEEAEDECGPSRREPEQARPPGTVEVVVASGE